MSSGCEYCGYDLGHNAVCIMNEVGRLEAANERLRAALLDCAQGTNEKWTHDRALRALEQSDRRAALDALTEHDQKLGLYEQNGDT